jgi:GNAT superfamily N-acetyltransferase
MLYVQRQSKGGKTMEIRKTTTGDTDALEALFCEARATIAQLGIDQWQNGYPSHEVIENDLALGRSYAVTVDGEVVGTFVLVEDGEPTYDVIHDGCWQTGNDNTSYVAIHRVAISVRLRGQGLSTAIIDYAAARARALGRAALRIDTHKGNVVMRRMLEKHGFTYCGVIHLENGDPRVAYEKVLE